MSAHNETRYRGCWLRLHADDRGIAMVTVGMLGAFLVMISVLVAARTIAESRSVSLDRRYEQAIHVAESGVDQALYALDTGADLTEVTLTSTPTKGEVVDSALAVATADPTEVVSTPEGDVVVIKDDTTNTFFGVGFSPGIDSANRSARVIFVDYSFVAGSPHVFPSGAVVANGDVDISADPGTSTAPASEHSADIYTNGDIRAPGGSTIDGDVSAGGTVTGADSYGTTTTGSDPVGFPTQDAIDLWQANLKAVAMTGPTLATLSGTVTAPAYLPGGIVLNCNCTVILNGPGVIYVDGSLTTTGQVKLENNGVTLVTADFFTMSGQSEYYVTGDPALVALIAFGYDPIAAKITGQGDAFTQGFVYAPNGGVKISGSGAFVGAIVAGGDIAVSNQDGIIHPDGLVIGTTVSPPTDVLPDVDDIGEL